MTTLPGTNDVGAVLELWKRGASIVPLRTDEPKLAACKWRHRRRRVSASRIHDHDGGYGMVLSVPMGRLVEDISIVDVDRTPCSEAETKATIEALVGAPPALWIPSGARGWHAVYVALPDLPARYRFEVDGIGGDVLSGSGAYISLWHPRAMLNALAKVRSGDVPFLDPFRLPDLTVDVSGVERRSEADPDVVDALDPSVDLFCGAVGPARKLRKRLPVLVDDDGRVALGHRNEDLFDQGRAYAYPRASACESIDDLEEIVFDYGMERTSVWHAIPLPPAEVLATARSISSWTWERRRWLARWRPLGFRYDHSSEAQARRGVASGKARRKVLAPRDARICELARTGHSPRKIVPIIQVEFDKPTFGKSTAQYVIARDCPECLRSRSKDGPRT